MLKNRQQSVVADEELRSTTVGYRWYKRFFTESVFMAVMRVRQFSRDHDRGRGSIDEADATPRQGSQKTMY